MKNKFSILAISLVLNFSAFAQNQDAIIQMNEGDTFSYIEKNPNPRGMGLSHVIFEVNCVRKCESEKKLDCERQESDVFNYVDLELGKETIWYKDNSSQYKIKCVSR